MYDCVLTKSQSDTANTLNSIVYITHLVDDVRRLHPDLRAAHYCGNADQNGQHHLL